MAYETILYSVEEGVATLTLNRPEVQNGFNIPVCDETVSYTHLNRIPTV